MKKIFKSKYFYITIILSYIIYSFINAYKPVIISIPVVFENNRISIIGKNFGKTQKNSRLEFFKTNEKKMLSHYMDWSDTLIRIEFPPEMTEGKLRINRKLLFFGIKSEYRTILKIKNFNKKNYDIPVQQESPWPLFRRNRKNTAFSSIKAEYNGGKPWMIQTDKGIFSTPVIDKNENIYIGSADHVFYAINSKGKIIWTFQTGEIIDSGAGLVENEKTKKTEVIVPSGDGFLYKLRTADTLLDEERIIWKFSAHNESNAHYNNWFEGNIAIGFNGEIYAGNTNFNYYCLNSKGKLNWKYTTKSNNWSNAAIGDDGTIYWGSNDNFVRAVSPEGKELWKKQTLGFIAASAAIGSDGTVYIGSFDSYFYALEPHTGKIKWKFKTNDHIYASAALEEDRKGKTTRILFGSTDGHFYALNPTGKLLWSYFTDDVIRSSAAIGASSENDSTNIAYFGAGNGYLYAINTHDGSLRWKYNTTSKQAELQDRNDLNASVALGKNGIYIAGEHGQIWHIPYDYPLHNQSVITHEKTINDGINWKFISSGGNLITDSIPEYNQSPLITLKLEVIENNIHLDANICNTPIICSDKDFELEITPTFNFHLSKSADGHYVYIIPNEFVNPGKYTINLKGNYYLGGWNMGNLKIGGKKIGKFEKSLNFIVNPAKNFDLLEFPNEINAFELTRITAPLPPMLPSLNQIGFDYMDWGIGIISQKKISTNLTKVIVWTAGIEKNKNGEIYINPETDFLFPMHGKMMGNNFVLENKNMTIPITGIPIPFNKLILSGDFNTDFSTKQAALYADTEVLGIPTFGKYLVLAGLANNIYKNLNVVGSFVTKKDSSNWTINKRNKNIKLEKFIYFPPGKQDGNIIFNMSILKDSIIQSQHDYFAICLIDENKYEPIYLDYKKLSTNIKNKSGEINQISLKIPAQTKLPQKIKIVFLVNLYPQKEISINSKEKIEEIIDSN